MTRPYIVDSPAQLFALASPGREDLVNAIGLLGPCKVSDLARFLDRTPHALYYHLRQLRRRAEKCVGSAPGFARGGMQQRGAANNVGQPPGGAGG